VAGTVNMAEVPSGEASVTLLMELPSIVHWPARSIFTGMDTVAVPDGGTVAPLNWKNSLLVTQLVTPPVKPVEEQPVERIFKPVWSILKPTLVKVVGL
jgi:hypothetical protein